MSQDQEWGDLGMYSQSPPDFNDLNAGFNFMLVHSVSDDPSIPTYAESPAGSS